MTRPIVTIVYNTCVYVVLFRLPLIAALQESGYEVVVLAPTDDATPKLAERGIAHRHIEMSQYGMNPLAELSSIREIRTVLRELRPVVSLHYTVKPNTFGSLAAHQAGVPVINNIAGAGRAFSGGNPIMRTLVIGLYRWALRRSHMIFFQNPDDMELFVTHGLVTPVQAQRLPGSGVDLERFTPVPLPAPGDSAPFRFLLIARMLWDKGIGEYVEAARRLRAEGRAVECQLLGFLGSENPSAVPAERIEAWEREGVIRYLGSAEDVRPDIAEADCVVLPSYREGTPRSLLEAASMARPIVTTDAVGCREAVEDGITGFLCQPRDAMDLTDKMRRMIDLPHAARAEMGQMGREKMVREFDESIVIDRYLQAVKELR